MNDSPLLRATGLSKHFASRSGTVRAVDGVDLEIARGETLGLVGESGCGKSTLARLLLQLVTFDAGSIAFDGKPVSGVGSIPIAEFRRRVQIVFQDPYRSLNPRRTIGAAIAEPLLIHGICSKSAAREQVAGLMREVGLDAELMDRYPHEFSGGQRQRVGIARALALRPELIVLDEPVSALDVSVQAQIVALLKKLQSERGLSYLFISHNLGVVRHLAGRVAVMYLGKIVETAPVEQFFAGPRHPYSSALLAAVPEPDPDAHLLAQLSGDAPDPVNIPDGCRFHPRCRLAREIDSALPENCRAESPVLRELAAGRYSACHYAERMDQEPGDNESRWSIIYSTAHKLAKNNSNEVLYAVDRNTMQVVYEVEGETDRVELPQEIVEKHNNLAIVHTHPDGMPPSPQDFGVLVGCDHVRQVTVVTGKYRYTLEKPDGWAYTTATTMRLKRSPVSGSIAEQIHTNEVARERDRLKKLGSRSFVELAEPATHNANQTMAKRYKLNYRKEQEL